MKHLNDDQIYILARKVADEADLTPEEAENLRHAADCDECYRLLCCMMAMQDMTDHMDRYALDSGVPVRETLSAVIRLAVNAVNAALDQLDAGSGAWTFRRAPMALSGARSAGRGAGLRKLTDSGDKQTYVAYDPGRQLLVIQISCAGCQDAPRAHIRLPHGETIPVRFQQQDDVFWAEVPGLAEGEYEILLEK